MVKKIQIDGIPRKRHNHWLSQAERDIRAFLRSGESAAEVLPESIGIARYEDQFIPSGWAFRLASKRMAAPIKIETRRCGKFGEFTHIYLIREGEG